MDIACCGVGRDGMLEYGDCDAEKATLEDDIARERVASNTF